MERNVTKIVTIYPKHSSCSASPSGKPTLNVHRIAAIFACRRGLLSIARSNLAATIRLWIARSDRRQHLAELAALNDHMLKDIGVSPEAALREAAKAFWQK
jgi:uncharacterized protein YjiS (DUF1127 family)